MIWALYEFTVSGASHPGVNKSERYVEPGALVVTDTISHQLLIVGAEMEASDSVELQIEVSGPQFGMEFWTEPIEGVAVQQTMQKSLPTPDELQHYFLLIKDGAKAVGAVLGVVELLKRMIRKRPDLKHALKIRVRMGIRIKESEMERIREVGCDVEFVREPSEKFEGGVTLPPRNNVDSERR